MKIKFSEYYNYKSMRDKIMIWVDTSALYIFFKGIKNGNSDKLEILLIKNNHIQKWATVVAHFLYPKPFQPLILL